jgi:two-component system chemotaxis response regulator CheY
MLTTEASKTLVDQGRAAGVTAWMVKPFKPAILLKGVQAILAKAG